MAEAFSIQIDDTEVRAALQRAQAATGNLSPVMKAIGERMVRSTEERFETETAPDGTRWEPLAASSLGSGFKKKKTKQDGTLTAAFSRYLASRQILTRSGELRGSIYSRPGSDQVSIGTGKVYAAIHQLGGKAGRGRKVAIPARPFLGVTDADRVEILELLREHMEMALNDG
ncbi:phage virion morphogenesis protein [Desulfuromonas sp. TF]|uniref:phage virion morphogenesis protein n=1 Tax=Desulfuromonas sp. TF TaxID=1232410 RepID=UPI00040C1537|nr:phage virion morphogenesis protein [Desulfuromonas sp. TF]